MTGEGAQDESNSERTHSRSWIVALYCLTGAGAGEAAQRQVKAYRKGLPRLAA